ncbi:MAG: hypothetical protein IJC48_06105 [Clostridia bacterium]|nr:hypothetical protein [Clostridia bacterium]MBQ4158998.1 hypothetical protein [Clostridia bacterium]
MQSIIVEIQVPATSMTYDFRLPSTGKISDIVSEIMRILETTEHNLLFDRMQPMLCDCERGIILKRMDTVAQAGLQDGARLMLI